MSGITFVQLSNVWAMLNECAPGYTRVEKEHHWWVFYNGKTFQNLSVGKRGSNRPEVYIAKIRSMVRLFGIKACAARFIPGV